MTKKAADKIVKHMEDYYRVDDVVDEPVGVTAWGHDHYSVTAILNNLKKNLNWLEQFYGRHTGPRMGKTIYANTITGRSSHKANDDLRDAVAYGIQSRASDLRVMTLKDRDLPNCRCFGVDYVGLEKRALAHGMTDPDDMEAMRAKPPVKLLGSE